MLISDSPYDLDLDLDLEPLTLPLLSLTLLTLTYWKLPSPSSLQNGEEFFRACLSH